VAGPRRNVKKYESFEVVFSEVEFPSVWNHYFWWDECFNSCAL